MMRVCHGEQDRDPFNECKAHIFWLWVIPKSTFSGVQNTLEAGIYC